MFAPSGTSSFTIEWSMSSWISMSPGSIRGSSRSRTTLPREARTSKLRAVVHGPVLRTEALWARMFSVVMGLPFARGAER